MPGASSSRQAQVGSPRIPAILARTPVILAWAGLILSLIYLFFRLGAADPASLNVWISSDTLYPVNVTTDILHDGYSLSGWRFSIAPCWFPDLFATGLFWVISRNVIVATLLAGFVQLGLIVGAFSLIRRAVGSAYAPLQTVVLLGVSVWITLFVAARLGLTYPDFYRFFLPQSHVGSLAMSLYALALGLLLIRHSYLGGRASRTLCIAYATVCLLAGMSNLMFFPQMLAPFTVAIAFVTFFDILVLRNCLAPVVIGWPAAVAGAILNRVLFHTTAVSAQSHISPGAALDALNVFMHGSVGLILALEPLHLLALLWAAVCFAIVATTVRKIVRQPSRSVELPWRMLCLFSCCWLFSDVSSCGALILGGSNGLTVFKDYRWTTHYLQSVFFVPLFGLPAMASWVASSKFPQRFREAVVLSGSLLIALVPAVCLASSPVPKTEISAYRPPLVRFLDDLASKEGLKNGLGGYWQSRIITLLSDKGLRVYAVDGTLHPFLWVSNVEWYTEAPEDRHKRPPVDFVVLDDPAFKLSRESAVRVLGEPLQEVRFGNTRVLIYSGHAANSPPLSAVGLAADDRPFAQFTEEITSSVKSLTIDPGQTISIPVTVTDTSGESWVSAGKYPVTLSYKWFDSGQMLNIEGVRTLLPRPLNPGQTVSFDAQVVGPVRGKDLKLRLSLVQEGVAWFFTRGAAPLDIQVKLK